MSDGPPTNAQEPSPQERGPTPEATAEPTTPGRLLAGLGVSGTVRLLIGSFGLVGLVVGVILVWNANSATTLAIVSAVLLVLAALGFKPKASGRGTDAVELSLRTSWSGGARYWCNVKTPNDTNFSLVTGPGSFVAALPMSTCRVVYPDEFPASEPLVPGTYEVEWRSAPVVDTVGGNPVAAPQTHNLGPPLATDSFTIPEKAAIPSPPLPTTPGTET
jgi:hypothetical protein